MYLQHSRARRAHEAAHGDIDVCHPGLAALEAVFVYSSLGEFAYLAGAYLLVVPMFSVRHSDWYLGPLPSSSPLGRSSGDCSLRLVKAVSRLPLALPAILPSSTFTLPHARIMKKIMRLALTRIEIDMIAYYNMHRLLS